MPKSVLLYKVFLASPSDVECEREAVKKAIQSYNSMNQRSKVKLELICWENNTYPSIGRDGQDVINQEIDDDYDIFIGILWTRFGTPTSRFESGTEEEFFRAYERYKNGNSTKIMIYKKDDAIKPSEIQSDQLVKVQKFVDKVKDLGCYYYSFTTSDNFQALILQHLSSLIQDIDVGVQNNNESYVSLNSELNDDNYGLLDFNDEISSEAQKCKIQLGLISSFTDNLRKQAEIALFEISDKKAQSNPFVVKGIVQRLAKAMNLYAKNIETPNKVWIQSFKQIQSAWNDRLSISEDFKGADFWDNDIKSVKFVLANVVDAISSMRTLYSAIKGLPRLTQPLNIAKNNVCANLKSLIENLQTCRDYCNNMIENAENKIHPLD